MKTRLSHVIALLEAIFSMLESILHMLKTILHAQRDFKNNYSMLGGFYIARDYFAMLEYFQHA